MNILKIKYFILFSFIICEIFILSQTISQFNFKDSITNINVLNSISYLDSNVSDYEDFDNIYISNFGQKHINLSDFEDHSEAMLNKKFNKFLFNSSEFFFATSGKNDNIFNFNFNKNDTLNNIDFDIYTNNNLSDYNYSKSNLSNINIEYNRSISNNLQLILGTNFYRRNNQLNGGLYDSIFDLFKNQTNLLIAFPTRKLNADLNIRNNNFFISNIYKVNSLFKINYNFAFSKNIFLYKEKIINDTNYYSNYYISKLNTDDSYSYRYFDNSLSLIYKNNFQIGVNHRFLIYNNKEYNISKDKIVNITLKYKHIYHTSKYLNMNIYAQYFINSYKKKDFDIIIENSALLGFNELKLKLEYFERTYEYENHNYYSNNFIFNKQLPKNKVLSTSIIFSNNNQNNKNLSHLMLNYNYNSNYLVYNNNAIISTNLSHIKLYTLLMYNKFKNFEIQLESIFQYQFTNKDIYTLPNIILKPRIIFKSYLLQRKLNVHYGIQLKYWDKIIGMEYIPAIDKIAYNNDSQMYGSYPFVDLFSEFYVNKNFVFFIKAQHINYFLNNKNFKLIKNYQNRDFILFVGIKWKLYD